MSNRSSPSPETLKRTRLPFRDLQEQVQALSAAVQALAFELERMRENERHEREKAELRLENALLRFERRLPPPTSRADALEGEA